MRRTKLSNTHRILPGVLALLPGFISAQSTSPVSTNSSDEKEEVFELSPFTVTADEGGGYLGSKTLAGNRLNMNVADVGASISVYTKELLSDLGATNSNELLIYTTGTEAAGPGGNYSGAAASINSAEVGGNGPRENPQTSRTRGLASPNFTRNFFLTDVPFDSYIIDSVTVSRGPNAVLFGVGSPAGVVDNTTISAVTDKDRGKFEVRFGDNASLRGSVDFNKVLIADKLAVRFATLSDRENFDQRPAFEDKDRFYGAVTWRPTATTTLRANIESGESDSNRPITVLPFNNVSGEWLADPALFDFTVWDTNPSIDGSTSEARGPLLGNGRLNSGVITFYPEGNATEQSNISFKTSILGGADGAELVNALYHPLFNQDQAPDNYQFWSTLNIAGLGSDYWTAEKLASLGVTGVPEGMSPPGTRSQGFTDDSAFDWRRRMIDETSRQDYNFDTRSIVLEQRAWENRLGVEVAYDFQDYERHAKNSFFSFTNGNDIAIDPNLYLPIEDPDNAGHLLPNPNVGRPFVVHGQTPWNNYYSERETFRGTGFLRYDFSDLDSNLGDWLGSHTLTGLYQKIKTDELSFSTRLAGVGDASESINSSLNNAARRSMLLVYVGDSVLGNGGQLQLNPIQIPELIPGPQPNSWYFARETGNSTVQGDLVQTPYSLVEILDNGSAQREIIESEAAILESRWLKEHLITLVGWRKDEDYYESNALRFEEDPLDPNNPGKIDYRLDDFDFASRGELLAGKETVSYSAVLKAPKSITQTLPGDTEFSLFYNKSENFTPLGSRINPFTGASIEPPTGTTEEVGFNIFALDDKLSLRASWFETAVTNIDATNTDYIVATQNGVVLMADDWANHANTQPGNADFYLAAIDHIFSGYPQMRDLYNFQLTETVQNGITKYDATWSPPAGRADVTDFEAKGFEMELNWNPTRNLRIFANVAKQETIQVESSKLFQEFMNTMIPVWEDLWNVPRSAAYPTGFGPGDDVLPQYTGPRTLPVWSGTGRQTLGTFITNRILTRYSTYKSTDGTASAEQRKWRFNLVANYNFGPDSIFGNALKGWSVGGALRWQDKVGIGYPTSFDPTAPTQDSVTVLVDQPYFAPDETNVDLRVGYHRKLWEDKIDWRLQLNVRNAIASDDFVSVVAQPWGEDAIVRIPPERRWYLTSTFAF